MAVMQSRDTRTMIAGSGGVAQFKFVKLSGADVVTCADGEQAFGVCVVDGAATNASTIAVSGKVMIEAGTTITAGDEIASDADGNCAPATANDYIMGYAMEAAVDGQIMAIELIQGGNTHS